MVSGASTCSYWAATYAWDMSTYAATVGITMLVFVINQDQSFIGSWAKAGAAVSMLLAFGLSVVPLSYCYSFAFSNHANAQVCPLPMPQNLLPCKCITVIAFFESNVCFCGHLFNVPHGCKWWKISMATQFIVWPG